MRSNRILARFFLVNCEISTQIRETRLSPRQAPGRSLLPLSPKRTQVRLKSLLYLVWLTPDPLRTHGRPSVQECRLRLKRPTPNASRRCLPFKSSTAFRALAPTAFFRGSLCFASLSAKKYGTPYFSARKRTSKYSRSCSQSLAELLSLCKTRPLWFFRFIWRGTSNLACWQRVCRSRLDSSLWLALPSRNYGNSFHGVRLRLLLLPMLQEFNLRREEGRQAMAEAILPE